MKHILTLAALVFATSCFGQESCPNLFDTNDNNTVDIEDFLAILGLFADNDLDDDGLWDSQDSCTDFEACNYDAIPSEPCGYIDALGLCGGECEGDGDGDGICDSEDDCIGVYDECGVCNGPGPTEVVIDEISILYDSVYAEQIDTWFVFEIGADTAFSFVCSGFECESPNWAQHGQDIEGHAGERMGQTAVISGDGTTVALGSITSDSGAGKVRIFGWDGNSWVPKGEVLVGEAEGGQFGHSLAISYHGDVIAIGAPEHDGGKGQAVVFQWVFNSWQPRGTVFTGLEVGERCGYSVALSSNGTKLAVGSRSSLGKVRVYFWNGSNWGQSGEEIEGENIGDRLGSSLAMSSDGTIVASGASFADGVNGESTGHVRVFQKNGEHWDQMGSAIEGETAGAFFGWHALSLSSNGTTFVAGAPFEEPEGEGYTNGSNFGRARAFSWNGVDWVQIGEAFEGTFYHEEVGRSVSISADGSKIAIGRPGLAGSVEVYNWDGNSWILYGVVISGEELNDNSGEAVCLSSDGTKLIVGAPGNDGGGEDSGHAKVYELECD